MMICRVICKRSSLMMNLQLLKRPPPLPYFDDEEYGIHAQWRVKAFYYRKDGFPQCSLKGQACVKYASLLVAGKFPCIEKTNPIGKTRKRTGCQKYWDSYREENDAKRINKVSKKSYDTLVRDSIRFLIVRQRVPHSLMGKPFEWQKTKAPSSSEVTREKFKDLDGGRMRGD
ncbi:hypothetical protein KIN20_018285 [Parelaphostrongylus tenuis]|uniref:Uncharacterized protein n=1 Tax=Parelaphostrongylus tenuis TaxID=148309 RepID=A0AAD5MMT3_PARTN|nr:hypothetical protein KIN20_018285 [Parelaphostrongylus tenuis]